MGYRQEQKFIISEADRTLLLSRLRASLQPDPYSVDKGLYRVRTLYFDDPFDSALFDSVSGAPEREKYRLRMYNSDQSFLRLEKKIKRYGGGQKPDALLSPAECRRLLCGDYDFLREKDEPFLQAAYAAARAGELIPRCVIEYTRAAFCYPAGNVRVTVDSDVRVSRDTDAFFKDPFTGIPALEDGACVLEVKYDDVLPDFIPMLLGIGNRPHTAMSKYAASGVYY